MTETTVTLVGNVATGVEFRESPTGGVARFRFAVPVRRWDRTRGDWTDGPTSFYTVWAWRALAANLAASVSVGEPLVVQGRLRVREEDREGRRRTFVDIEAAAAGHDLARGTSMFRRVARGGPSRVTPSQGVAVAGLLARAGGPREADPWAAPAGAGAAGVDWGAARAEATREPARATREEPAREREREPVRARVRQGGQQQAQLWAEPEPQPVSEPASEPALRVGAVSGPGPGPAPGQGSVRRDEAVAGDRVGPGPDAGSVPERDTGPHPEPEGPPGGRARTRARPKRAVADDPVAGAAAG
ncbi:hypothetical protein GCM10023082_53490 [Streptomyces tremellae]|uniref:Single-stranded DNA-binding protein n=1 Tax=Streptomyces tremellae TaxID=1124239 RepID=A0ABP7FX96_9ACTN